MTDRYIVGFEGLAGSIDPIEAFEVSEDGLHVAILSSLSTTLGSRIVETETTSRFLARNQSFYVYDTVKQTYLRDHLKETSE